MNKKGQLGGILGDIFLGIIIVFISVLVLGISFTIWVQFNQEIQNLPEDQFLNLAASKAEINTWTNLFLWLDKLMILIFVILWIIAIMTSLTVNPEHPFFFLVSLVSLFIFTTFTVIMVDFGSAIFDNVLINAFTSQLSVSYFFLHNLHFISFFVMLFSSVWFYSRGTFNIGRGIQ